MRIPDSGACRRRARRSRQRNRVPIHVRRARRRRLRRSRRLRWKQHIEQALLCVHLRAVLDFLQLLLAHHVDGNLHQVPHDRIHVAPYVPNFRELRSLNLQKGRVRQLRQAPGNFRFPHARGANHDDVLGHDLVRQIGCELLPPHAIAQRDRHRPLRRLLPNNVLVQLRDNLPGSQLFKRQLLVFRRSR